jgi:hypothetical protein
MTAEKMSNDTAAQRARLLDALRRGPISTIEARRDLDIMMPAARVFELRHEEGHPIGTFWTFSHTEAGQLHRIAQYVLLPQMAPANSY